MSNNLLFMSNKPETHQNLSKLDCFKYITYGIIYLKEFSLSAEIKRKGCYIW